MTMRFQVPCWCRFGFGASVLDQDPWYHIVLPPNMCLLFFVEIYECKWGYWHHGASYIKQLQDHSKYFYYVNKNAQMLSHMLLTTWKY